MEWSYDGYGLAVGWSLGGVSVWSAFGRLLMSTVSEDTFVQTPDGVSDQLPEAYFHGVRELFWGPGSYELFMLPLFGTDGAPTDIYVISFAKSAISLFNTMDNVRNVFLVCDDRILLYEGNNKEFDVMNLDLVQWDTLQIPVMYITQNWPIRYATISPSGNFLAIAGRRGLAHYSTESKRWKLFGNEQQEQSFVVRGGMLWHRNILIVACQDFMTSDHELRFLSRDANLDSSAVLHVEQMPSITIAMDCLDQNVLVYSGDNVMRYYRIVPVQGGARLRLHLHLQVSLQGVVHHPLYVQSIAWYPPPVISEPTVEDMKKAPVIILKNGELSLLRELSDEGWEHVILMDKIEYFWISRYGERCGDLFNSLWAFDGVGAKVWTNVILNPDTLTRWRPEETYVESLRIDLDCTPLTIMFHRGIIMGIEQRMSLRNSVNCAVFKHETKTHLFLHHIIRNLLMKKLQQEAVEFANCFRHLEYFGHALEVMLHKVLDDEVDTLSTSNVLPQIVKFLENFPSYLDVIVQCARKTEVSQWKYFFSIVGEVKGLFHQCLELGALTSATSYLIVIQTLEPPDVSGKLAVKLLDRAFEIEDFDTGRELVRFLASIEGDERVPFDNGAIAVLEEKEKFDRADAIRIHDDTKQDLWYVGILVGKSARRLLEKRRIRSLGRFAGTMSFNLSDFLKREKYRAAIINDWPATFAFVHEQFSWAYPSDLSSATAVVESSQGATITVSRRRDTYPVSGAPPPPIVPVVHNPNRISTSFAHSGGGGGGGGMGGGYTSASPAPPPAEALSGAAPVRSATADGEVVVVFGGRGGGARNRKSVVGSTGPGVPGTPAVTSKEALHKKAELEELRFLLSACRESECWQWALVLASILVDVPALIDIFNESGDEAKGLLTPWRSTLLGTNSRGYRQLLKNVEEILVSSLNFAPRQ